MPILNFRKRKKDPELEELRRNGNLITVRNVYKAYEMEVGEFLALKNINLTVGAREFVGVIGKSGSGKSTLINMVSGIDRPTSGEIFVDGVAIHNLNEDAMARWRGRHVGIVFQFFQLLPILTAMENVMLPMDFCQMYSPVICERVPPVPPGPALHTHAHAFYPDCTSGRSPWQHDVFHGGQYRQ